MSREVLSSSFSGVRMSKTSKLDESLITASAFALSSVLVSVLSAKTVGAVKASSGNRIRNVAMSFFIGVILLAHIIAGCDLFFNKGFSPAVAVK